MEYMESKMQDQIEDGISENERLHAELSRLRDLVREMREALEYYADFKSNTGHDGEYIVYLGCGRYQNDDGTRASEAIAKADAILKESGEPVKYGCHCELGPGEAPDGCVIDEGRPLDCVYTIQSSKAGVERKEDCHYWRPIK